MRGNYKCFTSFTSCKVQGLLSGLWNVVLCRFYQWFYFIGIYFLCFLVISVGWLILWMNKIWTIFIDACTTMNIWVLRCFSDILQWLRRHVALRKANPKKRSKACSPLGFSLDLGPVNNPCSEDLRVFTVVWRVSNCVMLCKSYHALI